MARCPFAVWKPLGPQTEAKLARKNKVILHTMVGSLTGTDAYFRDKNGPGYQGTESHFGVGWDGTIYQWQDTAYEADAQLEGNDDCISIETADSGEGFPSWTGSNVPPWTRPQLDALVDLVNWICNTHDIPKTLIADTKDATRGIGYHRQGIDPWRQAGCERYSTSIGKVCPGDRRVSQISTIIGRLEETMNLTDKIKLTGPDGKRWWAGQIIGKDEITVGGALAYAAASLWYSRKTLLPLMQAAAQGRALSPEEVQAIATAAAAAIPDDLAANVVDALGEALTGTP